MLVALERLVNGAWPSLSPPLAIPFKHISAPSPLTCRIHMSASAPAVTALPFNECKGVYSPSVNYLSTLEGCAIPP